MTKAQFKGIDLAIVEKFKFPIEKFNVRADFLDWGKKLFDKKLKSIKKKQKKRKFVLQNRIWKNTLEKKNMLRIKSEKRMKWEL